MREHIKKTNLDFIKYFFFEELTDMVVNLAVDRQGRVTRLVCDWLRALTEIVNIYRVFREKMSNWKKNTGALWSPYLQDISVVNTIDVNNELLLITN